MVAMETKNDPILSQVLYYTKNGQPEKQEPIFFPYFFKRFKLSQEEDVLI